MSDVLVDVKAVLKAATGIDVDSDLSVISNEELLAAFKIATFKEQYYAQISVTEKTFMNSIYGATGSAYFDFAHFNCAEDITGEGRFYIKKGQDLMNDYLVNKWHLDSELHQILENEFPGQFKKALDVKLPKIDYVIYIDTDSIYVEFDNLIKYTGYTGCIPTLIIALNNHRFRGMFADGLGGIVTKRHGENFLKFDLENTAAAGFFVAKKKYLLAFSWVDSSNQIFDEPWHHLKGKGIEIAQRSFSQLVIKLIKYILSQIIKETLNRDNYKAYMKKALEIFTDERVNMQECCKFVNLNKYQEYVAYSNADGWDIEKRALPQHKGAARYNHLLEKHKLTGVYEKLKDGYKVGYYLDINDQWFAYPLGDFPIEIAPPINRKAMFDRVVRRPIERFARLAGYDVSLDEDNTQCLI